MANKVKIVPFIGTNEVAPGQNFIASDKSRVAEMKRLIKQFPGVDCFEIETADGETHIADYTVVDNEPKLVKDAKREAAEAKPARTPVATPKAPVSLGEVENVQKEGDTKKDEEFDQGPESNRRIPDDDPAPETVAPATTGKDYERGLATSTIIATLEAGPCTRRDILNALIEAFPTKAEKVLRNTMGALVHSIMIRKESAGVWEVEKIQDKEDSRKITYKVTVKDPKANEAPPQEATAA